MCCPLTVLAAISQVLLVAQRLQLDAVRRRHLVIALGHISA